MVSEPQRLQYLEAMGLGAWTARYRLPNAAPTPQCEWPELDEPRTPPQARLHALLEGGSEAEDVGSLPPSPPAAARSGEGATAARSARALLEGVVVPAVDETPAPAARGGVSSDAAAPGAEPPAEAEAASPRGAGRDVALRFTLQVAALDGRWLLLLPQQSAPGRQELALLARLLEAAAIRPGTMPEFVTFNWPMMDNLPVVDALEEARQGLLAFVAGRRSRGWQPERVLSFGSLGDELEQVLDFSGELERRYTCLLDLPCWHGPALAVLARSAEHKRALWPELMRWRQWWTHGEEPPRDEA